MLPSLINYKLKVIGTFYDLLSTWKYDLIFVVKENGFKIASIVTRILVLIIVILIYEEVLI